MHYQAFSDIQQRALRYFQAPTHSFWKWEEEGTVIEWQNGKTICYREDLMDILNQTAPTYLLPLGSILLILAACQGDRKHLSESLDDLFQVQLNLENDPVIEHFISKAIEFLGKIADLPPELKKGRSRIHLIQQLGQLRAIRAPYQEPSALLAMFREGRLDQFLTASGRAITRHQFLDQLRPLQDGITKFQEPNSLKLFLQTGLKDIPEPAEIELPTTPSEDLLDQLAKEPQTYGLAKLTRQLIAALQIPMHTRGSSDQAFGGVSDISNRGELDRLLLSELAYDDDTLMARLVNNETLYYRHEEPPSNPIEGRVILIDTTMRMWGTPRAIAISAALALAQATKISFEVKAFAIGGKELTPIELGEKAGVLYALGQLDPALDCGDALLDWGRKTSVQQNAQTECILITGEDFFHQKRLLPFLAQIKSSLNFLIEVGRDGRLTTFQISHGNRKKIGESILNLEESLFALPEGRGKEKTKIEPAISNKSKIPLYLPAAYVQLKPGFVFELEQDGVMAITSTHRWLYWSSKKVGAQEIISNLPSGMYFWGKEKAGVDSDSPYLFESISLLIYQANRRDLSTLLMYVYSPVNGLSKEAFELKLEKEVVEGLIYQKEQFFIQTPTAYYQMGIDPPNRVADRKQRQELASLFEKQNLFPLSNRRPRQKPNFGFIKKFINPGFSTFFKISNIGLNAKGELVVEKKVLRLVNFNSIIWQSFLQTDITLQANQESKRWTDGSRAWMDNRGVLHLKSSDPEMPIISILTIVGKETACYSSDGYVCGSPYFVGKNPKGSMKCSDFYQTYIKSFLTVIQHNAT